jgi:hypothetical protein
MIVDVTDIPRKRAKRTPYMMVSTNTEMITVSRMTNCNINLLCKRLHAAMTAAYETMIQSTVKSPAAMIAPTELEALNDLDWRAAATAKVINAQKPVNAFRPSIPRLTSRDIIVRSNDE